MYIGRKKFAITDIIAREILDCRFNPTVQVDVWAGDEIFGRADVPAGRSRGEREAWETRDGDPEVYGGLGVGKAVSNINTEIKAALAGMDVRDQRAIDLTMIRLDGTPNKKRLGGNAIIGVSLACARAAARACNLPLYRYLNANAHILPVPLLNYINGGRLTSNDLDFQEICIFPVGAETFRESMIIGWDVYNILRDILVDAYGKIAVNVGDEGGFAPPIVSVREAMDHLVRAVEKSGHRDKIEYGFDCAATHFYDAEKRMYKLEGEYRTREQLLDFYKDLIRNYPIVSMEDPFDEDDVEGFAMATEQLGIQVVGDDFLCTNPELVRERGGFCNAMLMKFNQIGTLSESLDAAESAYRHRFGIMVSERSGETEDPILSDVTVGINAGQIKTGATRSERTVKYNRLLEIEAELGKAAVYAGRRYKNPM
ncbi:MAG: phosphopyruvate hydratase [Desulfovibrio sp.]|jgi:enolase|nr:phosphopyruvate hydratase [Desulfovibrio sp.]